jgi:hypothetical protein
MKLAEPSSFYSIQKLMNNSISKSPSIEPDMELVQIVLDVGFANMVMEAHFMVALIQF